MKPLHDPSYKPWLQRKRLELDVIMNIAEGVPIGAWPPKGKWWARFRMLKVDAIYSGELPAIHTIPPKSTSVALLDVWTFLATQQGEANWDWLREFCDVWSEESGVALPDPMAPSSTNDGRASTIGAQTRCRTWLIGLMSNGSRPKKQKTEYRAEAKPKFGVSHHSFDSAWQEAIEETGNTKWSRPGPKAKSIIHPA